MLRLRGAHPLPGKRRAESCVPYRGNNYVRGWGFSLGRIIGPLPCVVKQFLRPAGAPLTPAFAPLEACVYNALRKLMDHAKAVRRAELEALSSALDARFAQAMRAHGFDPAQADTTALPGALAELYAACAETQAELAELTEEEQG